MPVPIAPSSASSTRDAVIDHLRSRLDQLMMLLAERRPWRRRWFR
jgi:hypothetical protein